MDRQFDVLVIGAGPGGYHAAIRAAQLGHRVGCIDRDAIGGVCVNRGCIPTKALLHVGEVLRQTRGASALGIRVNEPTFDLEGIRAFTAEAVRGNVKGVESLFKANGVEFISGHARFTDRNVLSVGKENLAGETLRAKHVVIATGSAPIDVPGWNRDGTIVINSDDAVQMKSVPKRLLVVGGGVVGLEFATVFHRLGSQVTVVEQAPELLTGTDLEISRLLRRILTKQGIEILVGTRVADLKVTDRANASIQNGNDVTTREFDQVLVAVGRRSLTAGLGLERSGLDLAVGQSIKVDAQRRTTLEGLWAIGDVAGGPLLAHKAMMEGVVAAEAISGQRGAAYAPIAVPNCVYSDPQVATAGLSEEEARSRGINVLLGKFPLSASGRGRTLRETEGLIKLVADADSDLLLGVHIVGPQAESLIGEAVIALEMQATLEDIALSIHPHPTFTEAIHDAAEAAHGRAVHLFNRPARATTTTNQ